MRLEAKMTDTPTLDVPVKQSLDLMPSVGTSGMDATSGAFRSRRL